MLRRNTFKGKRLMLKLKVNNQEHTVDVPEDMPLLWVLRDVLKQRGTKFGCGMGQCGSCTVHINGQAMRSCITPVAVAKGNDVTTIEGLSPKGEHPIQVAWQDNKVPQCGYCQSGQIMSALNLLTTTPNPTDQQIDQFMAGNICRCGTYPRIKTAIKQAAKVMAQK